MTHREENVIIKIKSALIELSSVDDDVKLTSLCRLYEYMQTENPQINQLGYDKVIFKELNNLCATIDDLKLLTEILKVLRDNYFSRAQFGDELMRTIMSKAAMSRKDEITQLFLENLLILTNHFDLSLAKHANQVLQLVDTNHNARHSVVLIKILEVLKKQLPERMPYDSNDVKHRLYSN